MSGAAEQPADGSAEGALGGLLVLDFTTMLSGPYCTRLLADLGAEVIKIEAPAGDHIRNAGPYHGDRGLSAYFAHLNCGKKSLCLDLKKPEAVALVHRLVRRADVVVENFRPGVSDRLGLGYAALKKIKPDLIFCAISGFGQSGPQAARPAYAPIVHAASGYDMANLATQLKQDGPARTGVFVADIMSGALAAAAIQSALIHRLRTGAGQMVDMALMDAMLSMMPFEMQTAQFPMSRRRPIYTPIRAADGFLVVAPITNANFASLAQAIGRPEWIEDARFAKSFDRSHNWDELMKLVETWTSSRPAVACEATIAAAGCPVARYQTIAEAMQDPQVQYRHSLAAVDDGSGSLQVANTPFKLSATPANARPWAAELGQHNAEILHDTLGLDAAEIAGLAEDGVLMTRV